jgi:hypothetical protein
MKTTVKWLTLVWVGSFVLIFVAFTLAGGAPDLLKLRSRRAETIGVVTRVLPRSHGSVVVRYSVAGNTYERSFAPYTLREGAVVPVYYDPSQPQRSSISEPAELLDDRVHSAVVASLLVASCLTGACYQFLTRKTASTLHPSDTS